ncbi:MAG: peptidyl-prolyl cis-trans isomerase [Candidatus Omnitrophota bacterium]|nr:MAG: peptidyl-prolyl cis-trans isomerase [Candidatus Omnitrophota bacterium]
MTRQNKLQILLILSLGLLFMQPLAAETIDRIVAVVNDEVIAQTDVDRVLATIETEYKIIYTDPEEFSEKFLQAKENVISQMLEEKLILCETKKYDIKIDESVIDARIEQIKQTFPSERDFEWAIEDQGLTLGDLRDRFSAQETMKKAVDYFVRSKIKIDPIEIEKFYQSHKSELKRPEKAHVKSIFIQKDEQQSEYAALQKAKSILERLRNGETFEELERDLGVVQKDQLIEEIDKAIFSLQIGEFSDVIKSPQGYRIFKVDKKEPAEPLDFSESQDIIREFLYKEKFVELFREWVGELKQSAYIKIN